MLVPVAHVIRMFHRLRERYLALKALLEALGLRAIQIRSHVTL